MIAFNDANKSKTGGWVTRDQFTSDDVMQAYLQMKDTQRGDGNEKGCTRSILDLVVLLVFTM